MTIVSNSFIEIVVDQVGLNGQMLNVWQYQVGIMPGTVTPVQLAEGWWNHVKTAYRGIYPVNFATVFSSIRLRELNNPVGDYAEFDVPVAERTGTRSNLTQSERMPPFTATGVRLVVGSRATRPGQKRFANLAEGDQIDGNITGTALSSVTALMGVMTTTLTLGAPAATVTLFPIVTRKNGTGDVIASQDITGFIVNQRITSQNTRKYGRGS